MTTTPTASPEQAQHLPLGLLRPSPTNPRKRFPPAKITELAESIKKLGGNFTPILARPNPDYTEGNGQPRYEIVAGERRWRACAEAGMPSVLAIVRDISHFDALEIQLVENIDREDLHPLEEAEGLKALLRAPDAQQGYATAEELAQRIGKSRRWVFARLALLNLCESARTAFLADQLNASVAGLIARMPDAGQQAEATKRILEGWGGEPYSYRQAAEYLHKEFMLALDKAPFDIAASFQHAGPCGQCPKRSGAAPELFDDVKTGDMCQDSACYSAKTDATHQAALDAARAAGHTVLSGSAARELMPSLSTLPAGYHWFDRPCPALTDSKAPLRELFGNKAPEVITLDHPGDRIISLVPEAAAKKLLKAKGLLKAAPEPAKPSKQQQQQQAQATDPAAPAAALRPLSANELAAATQAQHRRLLASQLFGALHTQLQQQAELPVAALRMLIVQRMDDAHAEDFDLLYNARGWPAPAGPSTWPSRTSPRMRDLEERLQDLSDRELGELLIETLVLAELSSEPDLDDILDSDHLGQPTLTLARELGLSTDQLDAIDREAYDAAHDLVHAKERARLEAAAAQAQDATAAFVQHHGGGSNPKRPAVRYHNPSTGETWSGRGLMPKWLRALVEAGHRLDTFAVASSSSPAAAEGAAA